MIISCLFFYVCDQIEGPNSYSEEDWYFYLARIIPAITIHVNQSLQPFIH